MICLAIGLSLFVSHVGQAAAISAARAGAVAVADWLPPDFNCVLNEPQSQQAQALAADAVVSRLSQLAAVTPTTLSVQIDSACALVVGVTVSASSWLPLPTATAVVCHHRADTATIAVEALAQC